MPWATPFLRKASSPQRPLRAASIPTETPGFVCGTWAGAGSPGDCLLPAWQLSTNSTAGSLSFPIGATSQPPAGECISGPPSTPAHPSVCTPNTHTLTRTAWLCSHSRSALKHFQPYQFRPHSTRVVGLGLGSPTLTVCSAVVLRACSDGPVSPGARHLLPPS